MVLVLLEIVANSKGQADSKGQACYLESSNDVNPIIYGKLGFETKKKIALKRGVKVVELDCMVREPKV